MSSDTNQSNSVVVVNSVNTSGTGNQVLNDDVLIHIFGNLSTNELLRIKKVCHQFSACVGSALKMRKTLSIGGNSGDDVGDWFRVVDYIDYKHNRLSAISRQKYYDLVANYCTLKSILKMCPNIESLYLADTRMDYLTLDLIITGCPQLRHLALDGIGYLLNDNFVSNKFETYGDQALDTICRFCIEKMVKKNEFTLYMSPEVVKGVVDQSVAMNVWIPDNFHIKPLQMMAHSQ
ncbi:unnamed protein product [Oppiella nova]|uniref:F-box domain-containing protein n=1 Tax=Oppiella nova TaxID=334625 RepID=A0A7R9QVB7_9ACAR|nr:unnamed protein product [Oppiella nova]CAG2175726.1 unnamed protein product [Oppiella nova]